MCSLERSIRRVVALVLACLLVALGSSMPVSRAQAAADELVTLNFVNADIQAVIKAVAEITGRNILIDPRVTGTVNIVAPKPVPQSMVFSVLLAALRSQGFTAVGGETGFTRIVPEAEAKFYPGATNARQARGDQVVTEVFQLQYESAQQLVPILRPLVSPNNVINAFPASNTLIVTDYAENLRRIRRVINSVDQPVAGELLSIKLNNAAAVDVAQTLTRLLPEASAPVQPGVTPKVAVTIDGRTNSLLVRAENPNLVKRIRELATTLDAPTSQPGNIHVVYLKNAEAAKVAEVLRAILTGQTSAARTTSTGLGATPGGAGLGGQGLGGSPGAGGQLGQPPGLTPPGGPGGQQPGGSTQFGSGAFGATGFGSGQAGQSGVVSGSTVQAYPETNSVVIIAPDSVYNMLRATIDKLDARRAQVLVEALIMEVTNTRRAEFGIQWQDLSRAGGVGVVGGTNFGGTGTNIIGAAQNIGSVGTGLNLGVVRGKITIGGTEFLNLAALARALEADSSTNILSSPTLLTLDNEEARIIVGQNIPIVTGSFTLNTTGGGGNVNPFQTFERRDVGLTLRLKPSVTEGGAVKLQIYQEVSSIQDRTNPSGIITNKRSMESTVLVDDGQSIVLGGLISEDVQGTEQRVPILGSIPVLGALFRYETRTRDKTNLIVFLRPVVVRDSETASSLTGDRYDYIRGANALQQLPSRAVLPDFPPPHIPPVERMQPKPPARRPAAEAPTQELDLRDSRPVGAVPATPVTAPAPAVAMPAQVPLPASPVPQPSAAPAVPVQNISRTAPPPEQQVPAPRVAAPEPMTPLSAVPQDTPTVQWSAQEAAATAPAKPTAASRTRAQPADNRKGARRPGAAASAPTELAPGVLPRSYEPKIPAGMN